jgi:myo-inositol-1-phosphate synthase
MILQPELYPDLYKDIYHKVRINYYPPRGDNKEGWDNIDIFGWLGYPMQLKVDFLCRDSILAAPLALDLCLFMDLAARTRACAASASRSGSASTSRPPTAPPGVYPEHDLFIQSMKLKNTLRHIMGEDLITHLGLDYYAPSRPTSPPSPVRSWSALTARIGRPSSPSRPTSTMPPTTTSTTTPSSSASPA